MTLIVFLVIQTNIILFQFGMGIGISANIRIGHYLGGNNPIGAKSAYRTALTMICKSENVFLVRPKHSHSCCNTTNPNSVEPNKRDDIRGGYGGVGVGMRGVPTKFSLEEGILGYSKLESAKSLPNFNFFGGGRGGILGYSKSLKS